MQRLARVLVAVALMAALSRPAFAYVGPGAGITMLGALWAVLASVVLAIAAAIAWPIAALVRCMRSNAFDGTDHAMRSPEEPASELEQTKRR